MIQEDTTRPEDSCVVIQYLPPSQVVDAKLTDRFLKSGDALLEPLDYVRVEKVRAREGVTFTFEREGRAPEVLLPIAVSPAAFGLAVNSSGR